jgi:hypothetical protein
VKTKSLAKSGPASGRTEFAIVRLSLRRWVVLESSAGVYIAEDGRISRLVHLFHADTCDNVHKSQLAAARWLEANWKE